MNPQVSIIIPNFNREELIAATIESVTSATSGEWELLIADDHSTDNSMQIATTFAANDSRIDCWTRKSPGKGAPACRNEGALHSKGQYLIFLDSDDLLHRDCLQRRIEKFEEHTELDFLVFPGEKFDIEPGDLGEKWFTRSDDSLSDFLDAPAWQTSAVIWRKSSFEKLGGFREDLLSWQDWDLHVRALAGGLSFRLVDGAADHFVRRGHDSRISKNSEVKLDHLKQRKELFRDTVDLLMTTGNWNQSRQDLMIRRYVILAIQKHRAGEDKLAEITLQEMKRDIGIEDEKFLALEQYFNFETNMFYRSSLMGRLIRPFVKQYHRFRLGACVIQRAK